MKRKGDLAVNDSDIPKPPPEDFSKTTPNVNKADWGKTNYKYPAQPPSDDWGNTVANVRRDDMDFGKTFTPGADNPKMPDWGITQGNIRLPNDDFGAKEDNGGRDDVNYGATTPYFRLPEAERAKYQNVPLTPTQEAAKQQEESKKGGVPAWLWVSGGLFSMFIFAVVCLGIVYFFLIKESGYDVVIKDVPAGSTINVDNSYWAQSQPDGSYILKSLEGGKDRIIKISQPNFECDPLTVKSEDGVNPAPLRAKCKPVKHQISDECVTIKPGEEEKAARCANKALDDLGDNFSIDDLIRALNLYIIKFPTNKYDIPSSDTPFLVKASGYLKKMPPNVVIEVGGHTDSVGNDASNQILSDNRAKTVRAALINLGVKSEALTEKGYGASQPRDDNKTEDGRFRNRRIQYSAVKK